MTFDPNAIRQDYELLWGQIFDPAAWEAATAYDQYSFVQDSGTVYFACQAIDAADTFDAAAGKRSARLPLAVSERRRGDPGERRCPCCGWLGQSSSRQAIPCSSAGSASFVEGVMSIFIYTPKNAGSSTA